MITGAICQQEVPKASNNVLNEFCNFNDLFTWTKTAGGANANITNDILGRHAYYGLGSLKIDFTGTSQVSFNAGGTQMSKVIQRSGNYILSYAFDKSHTTSNVVFIVEMYVNGSLYAQNTITQDLYNTSGFVDNQWNTYFQNFALNYGDVVDFAFKAQSDTTGVQVYFDRFKLEVDDRGSGYPTIYTEAPLDIIEEENTITVGAILAGATRLVTASLTGAKINNERQFVIMNTPPEWTTLGLVVSVPVVSADNVVKFNIYNPTLATVTPTPNVAYNLKVVR